MKKILIIFFSLIFIKSDAQYEEYWARWEANYPETDIIKVLSYERYYADSIENHPQIAQYYSRSDKYRFQAEYLGKTRLLDSLVYKSMLNVFKLTIGNLDAIENNLGYEVLFKVGNEEIWMPIQNKIFRAFQEEIKDKDMVTLFCLYLNEHKGKEKKNIKETFIYSDKNVLYNIFYISEFRK